LQRSECCLQLSLEILQLGLRRKLLLLLFQNNDFRRLCCDRLLLYLHFIEQHRREFVVAHADIKRFFPSRRADFPSLSRDDLFITGPKA
jgi:hypothetical protein